MSRLVGEEKNIFEHTIEFIEGSVTNAPLTSSQREKIRKIRAGKIGELEGLIEYDSHTLWLTVQYVWHERFEYMLNSMKFNGTSHKFNMFARLVSENIPLVWKKEQLIKEKQVRTDAKIEVVELPNFENPYIKNNIKTGNKTLEELW